MNLLKMERLLIFLSLLCAISVFLMSDLFQSMAYWGDGLAWYWVGVSITYFLGLMGFVFAIITIAKRENQKGKSNILQPILATAVFVIILLLCGLLWTTFVIIAGMSGM